MAHTSSAIYGFPDAVAAFDRRHPNFHVKLGTLYRAVNLAFVRTQDVEKLSDRFIYFFGALVAEDFHEILLVAVNGYGAAAQKLLRSMYEFTVTLYYLSEHPEEVQRFLDFNRIQLQRMLRPIEETFGEGAITAERKEKHQKRFEEVKKEFVVKSCNSRTCDETRLAHHWSKLDFVSMAKKTGDLGKLLVQGYYMPLRHAHPTLGALSDRIEYIGDRMEFKSEAQPDTADQALMTAHSCILVAIEIQDKWFKVKGLKELISECVKDWRDIWSPGAVLPGENDT